MPIKGWEFKALKDPITVTVAVVGAVVAIVSVVVGVYQFWYVNVHEVSRQPPGLTVACSMKNVGRIGRLIVMDTSIQLRNTGKTRVFIPVAWFNMIGERIDARPMDDRAYDGYVRRYLTPGRIPKGLMVLSRHWRETVDEVANCGKLFDSDLWLEPDEDQSVQFLSYAPSDRYDELRLEFGAVLSKGASEIRARLLPFTPGRVGAVAERYARGRWIALGPDVGSIEWETANGIAQANASFELFLPGRTRHPALSP